MNTQTTVWLVVLFLLLAGCANPTLQTAPVAVQPTGTPAATAMVLPTRTALTNNSLPPDAEIAFIHEAAAGKAVEVTSRNGQMRRQFVLPQATGRAAFLAWSPDGQWLSAVLGTQWWLFARDGTPGQAVSIDYAPGTISRPAWSPDSTRIAFTQVTANRTSTTLTVLDVGTGRRVAYPVDTFEAETFSSASA